MAVELLQIWYKNTPYRGGLNGISNKNPTKYNGSIPTAVVGCLQVVFENTEYSFAYLIVDSENYFAFFSTKI